MMKSKRFQQAFIYAYDLHADQKRKGKDVPYISHLMGVAALVLEHGGTENQAIAALLHDAVEDQGGKPTLKEIRKRFGDEVADIVEGCTDAETEPKPEWRGRKEKYIAHLREAGPSVRLVAAADKLYNARTILEDYRNVGDHVWERFLGGKDGTLWYYRSLANTLREIGPSTLADELGRVVSELEQLVREADAAQ
ncbi:MAG: HD domain-containing protein [Nitrososphaerales archaeon]